MKTIAYRVGYIAGWLWNSEDMPLGMSIGEVLSVGGVMLAVLSMIYLLAEKTL